MAITVKHKFVSAIPDAGDPSIVQPSNWNDTHELTGLGTMAEQNANAVAITGGTMSGVAITGYIPTTEKAVANGVATLDGSGTVPINQLPAAVLGALSYQGTWNASTNTPTLTSSVGTKGYYYVVNVAGSTNLNGITDWVIGDWAVFNGSVWQKVDNTDAVTSVNGYTGTVVLTTTDVAEGTNQYFTTARARTSVSAGTGISYNSTTGVITNSSPSLGGDVVGPSSATDNAVARFDTTTGKLIQNSVTTIDDTGNASGILSQQFSNGSAVTLAAGKLWYDGSTGSWNAGMGNGNITQQIGEELFIYGKASSAITDSPLQIVYHTGTVGASGVITFAPTIAGITDENAIIGIATESIALNGFGRVTTFGVVRGITTNGTAFGETWADDDVIWYNPVTGNPTNVKPSAPNIKFQVGLVIKAGAGGSGSFQVALVQGTALGGTDSNVKITSVTNGNILSYDGGNGYWKNTDLTAGTGISVSKSINGVLTITNTSPSSGGTVTSVTGTAPVVSSGGNTPAISMAAANTTTDGYLTSTDWNTFNSKGGGSVTSVALTAPSIFTVTGSPITSSGTLALTYSGTALPILNGGTGQTTANSAFNALAPSQTSNSGKYLTTNGTDTSWASLGNAYSRTSFTATAAQTTFTVSYTVGLIQVYVNGVFLNGADYTATNGTSVVLAVGCNAGDIVETLAFSSFSVASTVSSFSGGTTGLTPSTGTTGNVTLGGTLAVANGGTGVTTSTGSGNLVLSTSPTLVTPILGTPTSATLTNATGLPLTTGVTGTLAVANGGTGVTTSTGSGANVLGTSPTIATPTITSLYGQNSNLVTTPYNGTGLIPAELIYRLNSPLAGSNVNTAQSLFGVGVTLSGSTVYQFETVFALSKSAGTTAHLFSLGFGGTATLNNIGYLVVDFSGSSSFTAGNTAGGTAEFGMFIQTASATQINSFSTSTTYYQTYLLKGTVSINAGGTFIPQYTLSAAPGGAYTTAAGSYFKLSPMSASGANTNIGGWA